MRDYLSQICLFLVCHSVFGKPVEYYATKYDHIDLDTFLSNKRLVQNYAGCFLGKKVCTPQGKEIRDILPEAIATNCARCTEKQKVGALRVIKRLQKEYPDIWKQLSNRWDPSGQFVQRFIESFREDTNQVDNTPLPLLVNRFGDETKPSQPSPNDLAPIAPSGAQDKVDTSKKTSNDTVTVTTSTTSKAITSATTESTTVFTSVTSTTTQRIMTTKRPHWFDTLGCRVLKTAGKLADMLVTTVEIVIGTRRNNNSG